jgi:quercetin dioxygenase-like cupin family protein
MTDRVRHLADLPLEPVGAGRDTARQLLTGPMEGSVFHMRRFVMHPGGGIPLHTNEIEHQQYVLAGEATIGLGDEVVKVKAGDVIHIPAGLPHWYRAEGNRPFEILCAVPNGPDQIRMIEE